MKYQVEYVHKIAGRLSRKGEAEIPDGAFTDRKTLAKALRDARILHSGERLHSFRVEGERVVAFPMASTLHSFILEPKP